MWAASAVFLRGILRSEGCYNWVAVEDPLGVSYRAVYVGITEKKMETTAVYRV